MTPVLFAFDGSPGARAAIERSAAVLRPGPGVVEDLDAAGSDTAEKLAAEGAELARAAGFDATARPIRSPGPFFAALVELADEIDASAIVMGSRGRSTLAATVLGSVSTGVLHHSHRPVLVVHGADG
jgi:nucleotide-binding universal stress UspA family protein